MCFKCFKTGSCATRGLRGRSPLVVAKIDFTIRRNPSNCREGGWGWTKSWNVGSFPLTISYIGLRCCLVNYYLNMFQSQIFSDSSNVTLDSKWGPSSARKGCFLTVKWLCFKKFSHLLIARPRILWRLVPPLFKTSSSCSTLKESGPRSHQYAEM